MPEKHPRIQIHITSSRKEPEMEAFFLRKVHEGEIYKTSKTLYIKKEDGMIETVLFYEFRGPSRSFLIRTNAIPKSGQVHENNTDKQPELF